MKQTSAYSIGVIISTYNNPAWLEKVLWGYLFQTHPADEIVIADDGSKEDTRRLIESFKDKLPIKHVWHEDNGFQKSRILNSAILASASDYLIFTDQDCIPRKDFIATHAAYAEKGYFLSGGYFKLPMDISKQLTYNDIKSENAFSLSWLKEQHMKCNFKCTKLIKNKTFILLHNNRSAVGNLVYYMHRSARNLNTLFQSCFVNMKPVEALTAKRRYKRRVNVYDSVFVLFCELI